MKKLIIANWKMQLPYQASLKLAADFVKKISGRKGGFKNEVVVCPDHLSLPAVAAVLKKSRPSGERRLFLGAQDGAAAARGAYTGEVSALDLKALGVKYVIIGHSERRQHLHENAAIINAKIKTVLRVGLVPVLCIGEKLTEKKAGQAKKFLSEEVGHSLKGVKIKNAAALVIAYEPLWAIGTGESIIPLEAEIMNSFIKRRVALILRKTVRVLYGGSVDSRNAAEFLKQKNVDGLLVGGASLKLAEFSKIANA